MRIGCVYAKRSVWPKWDWVRAALIRLGHEVIRVHHADQLLAADELCELMLFEQRDGGIGWRHIRDKAPVRKSKWVQWWWDLFGWDEQSIREMLTRYGNTQSLYDRVYVKERACLDLYRSHGVHAAYLDQGIPSDWPGLRDVEPEWDVLGFGKIAERKNRVKSVKALVAAGYRVAWAGQEGVVPNGVERLEWCPPKLLPALMERARCVLCLSFREDVDGYCSDRDWMVKGAGAIPVRTIEEVAAVCAMTLDERRTMGEELRRHTLATNTYEHRLADILRDFGGGFRLPVVQGAEEAQAIEQVREVHDAALSGL